MDFSSELNALLSDYEYSVPAETPLLEKISYAQMFYENYSDQLTHIVHATLESSTIKLPELLSEMDHIVNGYFRIEVPFHLCKDYLIAQD